MLEYDGADSRAVFDECFLDALRPLCLQQKTFPCPKSTGSFVAASQGVIQKSERRSGPLLENATVAVSI